MNSEEVQHTTQENLKIQHQCLPNHRPRYTGILWETKGDHIYLYVTDVYFLFPSMYLIHFNLCF